MNSTKLSNKQGRLARNFGLSLLFLLAYIPFHAFFSVWLGDISGYPLVFKAWKEAVLGILAVIAVVLLWRNKPAARQYFGSRINQLAMAFVALHGILALFLPTTLAATAAGLAIDTRYVVFFLLVRVAVLVLPDISRRLCRAFLISGAIVIGFGVLQQYLLPADFLQNFGYSKDTIAPYLTVDNNPEYVRINSTLRGPNPLGAFAMIYMTALSAYMVSAWPGLTRSRKVLGFAGLAASGSVLYASQSRSAMLAAAVSLAAVGLLLMPVRLRKLAIAGMAGLALLGGGIYYVVRDTPFVQIVIEHKDPNDPVGNDSNVGHANSLADGTRRVLEQPFGAGIGSTGSASLRSDTPLIIENHYLFVAHESGWLGLILFIALQAGVLYLLYRNAADWRAASLFASGLGLVIIGLLLPVFADDTIAYLWWGLAGAYLVRGYPVGANQSIRR